MSEGQHVAAAGGSGGPASGPGAQQRIVVGVDGSEPSKAALAWAVRHGEPTGAVVEAVIAWDVPSSYGAFPVTDVDFQGMAAQVLASAIAEVGSPAGVQPRVLRGHAAQALVDASGGADLLVVDSRGHGGFVGALLGSLNLHCVHHASCPVVVIRGKQAARGATQPP